MQPIIIIPPEFSLLFFIPIIGFFYVFDKSSKFSTALFFYLFSQIALAMLARYIYG